MASTNESSPSESESWLARLHAFTNEYVDENDTPGGIKPAFSECREEMGVPEEVAQFLLKVDFRKSDAMSKWWAILNNYTEDEAGVSQEDDFQSVSDTEGGSLEVGESEDSPTEKHGTEEPSQVTLEFVMETMTMMRKQMQQQQEMVMLFMKQQQQQTQELMALVLADKHRCSCSREDDMMSVPPGEWIDSDYESENSGTVHEERVPGPYPLKRRHSVDSGARRARQEAESSSEQEAEWASRAPKKGKKEKKKKKKKEKKKKENWAGMSSPEGLSSGSSESESDEPEGDEEVEPSHAEASNLRSLSQSCWNIIEVAEAQGCKGAPRCKNELERLVNIAKALEDVMTYEGAQAIGRAMKMMARGAFGDWGASKADKSKLDKLTAVFSAKKAKELLAKGNPNGYSKAAARGAAATAPTAQPAPTQSAQTGGAGKTKKEYCFRCGDPNHKIARCSYAENVCHACKQPGHFRKNCPASAQSAAPATTQTKTA